MKKAHVAILGFLLAALAALLFLLLPITPNLIVACAFWLVGVALLVASVFALGARNKSVILELPMFFKARAYLAVTAVLSAAVLLLEHLNIYTLPLAAHLAAQAAALLALGIQATILHMGKSHIQQAGSLASDARGAWMGLVSRVGALKDGLEALPGDARPGILTAITALSDALRYSDPVSSPDVRELDGAISAGVDDLSHAIAEGQADEALRLNDALLDNVRARNEHLRNSKGEPPNGKKQPGATKTR